MESEKKIGAGEQKPAGRTEKALRWLRNIGFLGFLGFGLTGLLTAATVSGAVGLGAHAGAENFRSGRTEDNKTATENKKKATN